MPPIHAQSPVPFQPEPISRRQFLGLVAGSAAFFATPPIVRSAFAQESAPFESRFGLPEVFKLPLKNALEQMAPEKREAFEKMLSGLNAKYEAEKTTQARETFLAAVYLVSCLPYGEYSIWKDNQWGAEAQTFRDIEYATPEIIQKRAEQSISMRWGEKSFAWARDAQLETYLMANTQLKVSESPVLGVDYPTEPLHPIMKEVREWAKNAGINGPVTLHDVIHNQVLFKMVFSTDYNVFWNTVRHYEREYMQAGTPEGKTNAIRELNFFLNITFLSSLEGVRFFNNGYPVGPSDFHPLELLGHKAGRCEQLDELVIQVARELGLMGIGTWIPAWNFQEGNHTITSIIPPFDVLGGKYQTPWDAAFLQPGRVFANGVDNHWGWWHMEQGQPPDTFKRFKELTGRQDIEEVARKDPIEFLKIVREASLAKNDLDPIQRVFNQFRPAMLGIAPAVYGKVISLEALNQFIEFQKGRDFSPRMWSVFNPAEQANLTNALCPHPNRLEFSGLNPGEFVRLAIWNSFAMNGVGIAPVRSDGKAIFPAVGSGNSISDGHPEVKEDGHHGEGALYFAFRLSKGEDGKEKREPLGNPFILFPNGSKKELSQETTGEKVDASLGWRIKDEMKNFINGVPEGSRGTISFSLIHPPEVSKPQENLDKAEEVKISFELSQDGTVSSGKIEAAQPGKIYLLAGSYKTPEGEEKGDLACYRPAIIQKGNDGGYQAVFY